MSKSHIKMEFDNDTAELKFDIEAGEAEGIYMATFPLEEMRAYREKEVHVNAYRRPDKYHLLISNAVCQPFIRNDRRK